MKVRCEKCGAQFAVVDNASLRGRMVKIRCHGCKEVLSVQPQEPPATVVPVEPEPPPATVVPVEPPPERRRPIGRVDNGGRGGKFADDA